MKKYLHLAVVVLLLSSFPILSGAEAEEISLDAERRYIDIHYTFEAPVLDGYIDPLEWNSELSLQYFDAFDGESYGEVYPESGSDEEFTNQSDLAVTFYTLYDDEFLYFAVNVTDDSIIVDSGSTYWRDDGVELLIDGAHDMDEDQREGDPWPGFQDGTTLLALADGSYFHDYSNGTPYERDFGQAEDWYCRTRVSEDENYYIAEMRLRLDSITSPLPNSTIGFNVGINDDDTGGTSKTSLKWEGSDVPDGANETFRNETLWGIGRFLPYVNASLPSSIYVDEDTEITVSSNRSTGNNPDFEIGAVYNWLLPLRNGSTWNNYTSTGPLFTYVFEDPSVLYRLHLEVQGPSGVVDEASAYVHVADITPPRIVSEDGMAREEEPFTYILNAVDNTQIKNVSWSLFDDQWYNTTTLSLSFQHTFAHPGFYELYYTVYDTSGNSMQGSSLIEVIDNMPPYVPEIPNIEMNTSGPMRVSAEGSYDDTAEDRFSRDLTYNWTIMNQRKTYDLIGPAPNISIDLPGLYNGTVEVTDLNGFSTIREFLVFVEDTTAPLVDLIVPNIVDQGEIIGLNPFATTDNDPDLWDGAVINWTVEQSSTSYLLVSGSESINISFPGPGTANITLVVIDPSGNMGKITVTLEVLDSIPPVLDLVIPDLIEEDEPFLLDLSGSSDNTGIVSIHYSLSDNNTGVPVLVKGTPPFGIRVRNVHPSDLKDIEDLWLNISEPGIYILELWLKDSFDLETRREYILDVLDTTPPSAILNRTYAPILVGELLLLSASQSSDGFSNITFRWMLDGEIFEETGTEFGYLFTNPGVHEITLIVYDARGNSDQAVCLVDVVDPPKDDTGSSDNTQLLMWGFSISVILLGTLFIFLWARSKRKDYYKQLEEE